MRRAGLTLCICHNIGCRTAADKAPSAASPLLDVLKVRRRRASTTSATFYAALRENKGCSRPAADKALSAASPLLDVLKVRRRRASTTSATFCAALRENKGCSRTAADKSPSAASIILI